MHFPSNNNTSYFEHYLPRITLPVLAPTPLKKEKSSIFFSVVFSKPPVARFLTSTAVYHFQAVGGIFQAKNAFFPTGPHSFH